MGSKALLSSAYHPQTDGQSERHNRTIEYCIHCLAHERTPNWLAALAFVEIALNTSVADSTGVSPHYLVHGSQYRASVDLLDGMHAQNHA